MIARTSAFQFKGVAIDIRDVGQRLGADLVIEGSVRKAGEQLRITAQAVETVCGHHLWSKTFRREMKDIFAIQEEIAGAVADLLRVHAPARPASHPNLDAYTQYLSARFLIHQRFETGRGSLDLKGSIVRKVAADKTRSSLERNLVTIKQKQDTWTSAIF